MLAKIKKYLDVSIFSVSSAIVLIMIVAVVWQVFSRYILNDPSKDTDEIARFSLIWLGLLGASFAFGQKSHIALEFFVNKFFSKQKHNIEVFTYILTFCFIFFVMIVGGYNLVSNTMLQISPSLQIKMGIVYLILPISGVISCIYLLLNLINLLKEESTRS